MSPGVYSAVTVFLKKKKKCFYLLLPEDKGTFGNAILPLKSFSVTCKGHKTSFTWFLKSQKIDMTFGYMKGERLSEAL